MLSPTKVRLLVGALVLSGAGVASIQKHEGTLTRAYRDPVGIPTVCTGHTGPEVRVGADYTKEQCAELLRADTLVAQQAVKSLVKVPVTQGQYDVLVSFTFNVGRGNLAGSTLLRKLNAGDCIGAANEFSKWTYARGKQLPGLVIRRADDKANFVVDCYGYSQAPQATRASWPTPHPTLVAALASSPQPSSLRLAFEHPYPVRWRAAVLGLV